MSFSCKNMQMTKWQLETFQSFTNLDEAKGRQRHDPILSHQCNGQTFRPQDVTLERRTHKLLIVVQLEPAPCGRRRPTLILDSSMVDPSEAMVTTRLTTKATLMALLIAGGMRGLKAEVSFPAVALNTRLPFCHDSRTGVAVMLPLVGGKKNKNPKKARQRT